MGDKDEVFLLDGVREGFHLVSEFEFSSAECDNYPSAVAGKNKDLVEAQILVELKEDRYEIVQEKPSVVSALGVVPKSNGGIRLIHDASRPVGLALNDYARVEMSQKFQTLKDAVESLAHGDFLAKVDLRSAYRYVPVHPSNFEVTGLKWRFAGSHRDVYMVDKRLPFGARLSPGVFHRLTQAVRRMMAKRFFQKWWFISMIFLLLIIRKKGVQRVK